MNTLRQRIIAIANDYHPDSDKDAPLALSEMREALLDAAINTPSAEAVAVAIARKLGDEEINGSSDFRRGVAYASESIALEIEDEMRKVEAGEIPAPAPVNLGVTKDGTPIHPGNFTPPPAQHTMGEPHPDDLAVDRFAAAMKSKLAKKRDEGRGGWDDPDQCHIDYLVSLLMEQIHERAILDPVDIANLSMMIHERGETPDYGR